MSSSEVTLKRLIKEVRQRHIQDTPGNKVEVSAKELEHKRDHQCHIDIGAHLAHHARTIGDAHAAQANP